MNALFLIVNSEERQRSFGSYPSCKVYMHIERLDVDFQQISKYAVADSLIWRQTCRARQNESRQKFIPFREEGSQ